MRKAIPVMRAITIVSVLSESVSWETFIEAGDIWLKRVLEMVLFL